MALITTYGGPTSDSYITLVEASAFLARTTDNAKWLAVPDNATREIYLLTATRNIDARRWRGDRFFFDQLLEFPRTLKDESLQHRGIAPLSENNIEYRDMELRVKEATAIQAVWEIARASGEAKDFRLIQMQGVRSVSQGGGIVSGSQSFGAFAHVIHPDALARLNRWRGQARVFRG